MIDKRQDKIENILSTIQSRISEINWRYRKGPDLYFYRKTLEIRENADNIKSFLADDYNAEILYATLVSWDMNSRAAKMKYFDDFRNNLMSNIDLLQKLESSIEKEGFRSSKIPSLLQVLYDRMNLMLSNEKMVANSKVLHYLFPNVLIPIDRTNTILYLYGKDGTSRKRYLEAINFSFDVMESNLCWGNYLDEKWNSTIPKLIDNAIILIEGRSLNNS